MRAARLHGIGELRIEDVPSPGDPAEGWVRCRVTAAGICGSDLHNYRTGMWISRAPSTPGPARAGIVPAGGAGGAGFAEGDAVVADSRVFCGTCPACRAGRHNLCASLGFVGEVCDGGFAEEVVLPARLLHKVDPELDPKKWPLEAGQIVEEFVVGDDVDDSEYGRDWAVMRRWGVALDTGTLVFRNDEDLEPE